MRLSRRASAAAAASATPPPGPFCAHCARSLAAHDAHIRCAAPECASLPLCIDCFSVGAADVLPHRVDHPYRVEERINTPVYAADWSAHEEARLLFALMEHGPCHWRAVAEYVRSKSFRKCEAHYHEVFLDGKNAPLPDDGALDAQVLHESAASSAPPHSAVEAEEKDAEGRNCGKAAKSGKSEKSGKAVRNVKAGKAGKIKSGGKDECGGVEEGVPVNDAASIDGDATKGDGRTVRNSSGVRPTGSLEGFMPLRGDFDVEWDDDAETLIADLSISREDTTEEKELKIRLLEMYDNRLQRRNGVKQFLFSNGLLDFASLKGPDKRSTRDEKELSARLEVFKRHLSPEEYKAFRTSVMTEYTISKDVYKLAQCRGAGVHHMAEMDIYEVERRVRANRLAEMQKSDIKRPGRVTPGGAARAKSKSEFMEKLEACSASRSPSPTLTPRVSPSLSPSVGPSSTPRCSPTPLTPTSASAAPGVVEESTAKSKIQVPGATLSIAANDSSRDPLASATGESKTATLRKMREQKRIMRSPYPQLVAMPINGLEDAAKLTRMEKKMCSSLGIQPREFLKMRDAMLLTANKEIRRSRRKRAKVSDDTPQTLLTMRTAGPPARTSGTNAENVDGCFSRLSMSRQPVTRGSEAVRKDSGGSREVIGSILHRVSSKEQPQIGQNGRSDDPAALKSRDVEFMEVKIERVAEASGTERLFDSAAAHQTADASSGKLRIAFAGKADGSRSNHLATGSLVRPEEVASEPGAEKSAEAERVEHRKDRAAVTQQSLQVCTREGSPEKSEIDGKCSDEQFDGKAMTKHEAGLDDTLFGRGTRGSDEKNVAQPSSLDEGGFLLETGETKLSEKQSLVANVACDRQNVEYDAVTVGSRKESVDVHERESPKRVGLDRPPPTPDLSRLTQDEAKLVSDDGDAAIVSDIEGGVGKHNSCPRSTKKGEADETREGAASDSETKLPVSKVEVAFGAKVAVSADDGRLAKTARGYTRSPENDKPAGTEVGAGRPEHVLEAAREQEQVCATSESALSAPRVPACAPQSKSHAPRTRRSARTRQAANAHGADSPAGEENGEHLETVQPEGQEGRGADADLSNVNSENKEGRGVDLARSGRPKKRKRHEGRARPVKRTRRSGTIGEVVAVEVDKENEGGSSEESVYSTESKRRTTRRSRDDKMSPEGKVGAVVEELIDEGHGICSSAESVDMGYQDDSGDYLVIPTSTSRPRDEDKVVDNGRSPDALRSKKPQSRGKRSQAAEMKDDEEVSLQSGSASSESGEESEEDYELEGDDGDGGSSVEEGKRKTRRASSTAAPTRKSSRIKRRNSRLLNSPDPSVALRGKRTKLATEKVKLLPSRPPSTRARPAEADRKATSSSGEGSAPRTAPSSRKPRRATFDAGRRAGTVARSSESRYRLRRRSQN